MVHGGERRGWGERRYEVRCLAWRSGEEQMACIRLPAAVDGTADEALEVARDELRLRSGGLHATPVRALLGVIPVGSPAADASGVRALAVDGGRVLLYGGYRDQANRCLLFDLDEPTMANPRPGRLALPRGPAAAPGFLVGRGPSLHATGWYRLDLRQIGGHR